MFIHILFTIEILLLTFYSTCFIKYPSTNDCILYKKYTYKEHVCDLDII